MKTTVITYDSVTLSGIFNRHSLKASAPALFLLLCCSIGAFAQPPTATRESTQKAIEQMRRSAVGTQELISFKDTPLKAAIYSLGIELGLNVLFDEAIKDTEMVSVELCDTTFGKALDIVLLNKKMQAGYIAEKTLIIFHDSEDNRRRYGQLELWLPPWPKGVCLQP